MLSSYVQNSSLDELDERNDKMNIKAQISHRSISLAQFRLNSVRFDSYLKLNLIGYLVGNFSIFVLMHSLSRLHLPCIHSLIHYMRLCFIESYGPQIQKYKQLPKMFIGNRSKSIPFSNCIYHQIDTSRNTFKPQKGKPVKGGREMPNLR